MKLFKVRLSDAEAFFSHSSIHGMQYLTQNNSCFKKIVWSLLLIFAFVSAGLVIRSLMENWEKRPIITSFDTTTFPIQDIHFPAVTICKEEYDPLAFVQR